MKGNNNNDYPPELQMSSDLIDALEELSEHDKATTRVIDENVFRTRYLDLLTTPADGKVDLSPWIDVAGSPYEPVHVIKDKRVLFTVPPMMVRHPTSVNGSSAHSVATIVREASLDNERLPAFGVKRLYNGLTNKIQVHGHDVECVKQMNQILAYYGKPTIGLVDESITPAQTDERESIVNNDDEWEDLF